MQYQDSRRSASREVEKALGTALIEEHRYFIGKVVCKTAGEERQLFPSLSVVSAVLIQPASSFQRIS